MLLQRRNILRGMALAVVTVAVPRLSWADEFAVRGVIDSAFGGRAITPGRIFLDLPPLAESGNSVPMTVRVDSPMTEADYVRRILVMSERNPRPRVIEVFFAPGAGKAEFSTRIRLNGTQNVLAYAEMADGSVWMAETEVTVTVGACEPTMITFPSMGGG
jgi:sulfur-oxidizing protein SoxY